jgi:hypothetical protein
MLVREGLGNRINELFRRECVLRVTPVHSVSSECGIVAEVFLAGAAILTHTIGVMKPRDAHPIPDVQTGNLRTQLLNPPHYLVPWNQR